MPASNKLTMSDITKSPFIKVSRDETLSGYDLEELFRYAKFAVDTASKQDIGSISGTTSTERPVQLFIRHLIGKNNLSRNFQHFNFSISESILAPGRLSPLLSSLTIKPDTSISLMIANELVTILCTEMHSGPSYENTLAKLISNTVDMHRLMKMYNPQIGIVYSLCFPKYNVKTCVTLVECKFNAVPLGFSLKLKSLAMSHVEKEVVKVLKHLPSYFPITFKPSSVNHSYLVRLAEEELTKISTSISAKTRLRQIVTSRSIVLTDEEKFFKYVFNSDDAMKYVSMGFKKNEHVASYSLEKDSRILFVTHALIPHLDLVEAGTCLFDFARLVKESLDAFHKMGYAHLDVRLPNICFNTTSNGQLIAVLIDLDRAVDSEETSQPLYDGKYYSKPFNWTAKKLDWKQLGLTIQGVTRDATDTFVQTLIENGKLYHR